jgi:hypothetical protein
MKRVLRLIMKTDSFDGHSFYLAGLIALVFVPGALWSESLVPDLAAFEVQ